MKIKLCSVGKPHEKYIKEGVEDFTSRIQKYYPAEWCIIAPPKNAAALSEHMHLVLADREKRIREGIFGSHELKLVLQQQEERCLQATQLAIDDMFTEIVDGTPALCKSFCLPFSQSVKLST